MRSGAVVGGCRPGSCPRASPSAAESGHSPRGGCRAGTQANATGPQCPVAMPPRPGLEPGDGQRHLPAGLVVVHGEPERLAQVVGGFQANPACPRARVSTAPGRTTPCHTRSGSPHAAAGTAAMPGRIPSWQPNAATSPSRNVLTTPATAWPVQSPPNSRLLRTAPDRHGRGTPPASAAAAATSPRLCASSPVPAPDQPPAPAAHPPPASRIGIRPQLVAFVKALSDCRRLSRQPDGPDRPSREVDARPCGLRERTPRMVQVTNARCAAVPSPRQQQRPPHGRH